MFGLEGEVFGVFDNGILAVFALLGIDVDKRLGGSGIHGALYGGLLGNTASDCIGALADAALREQVVGITVGCFEVFVVVYIGVRIWDALRKIRET